MHPRALLPLLAAHAPRVHPRALLPLLAALALASCGTDGTARYAGLVTWTDATSAVRVRYLTPPWNDRGSDGTSLRVEVDSVTGPEAGVPPKYAFYATVEPGTPATALAADFAVATSRGETVLPDADGGGTVGTVTTDSGDTGSRWVGVIGGTYTRSYEHVAFAVGAARVLHIQIEANSDPRTRELDAMVANVDVVPFSPP